MSILHRLQQYLPVEVYQTSDNEDVYELFDKKTNEQIGMYTLNDQGELASFSLEGEAEEGNLSKEELIHVAEEFIDTFHLDKKQEYELSAVMEFDQSYMISYEKREDRYGLFLHSEGFTVTVTPNGKVQQFYYAKEDYEIIYPETIISEEKALEMYLEHLDFELNFRRFDRDTFKNGDQAIHLAYSVNENILEIPADGRAPDMLSEKLNLQPIAKQEVPKTAHHLLLGLSGEHILMGMIPLEGEKRIEVWTRQEIDLSIVTDDMDEIHPHVTKTYFDGVQLLGVSCGEQVEGNDQEIGVAAARQKALDVMFKFFPDTYERFLLETEENVSDREELDEEYYEVEDSVVGAEETYMFYFHLISDGVRVENCVTTMAIGKYSGKVIYFQLNVLEEQEYQQLKSTPLISKEEAKKIYLDHLKMELVFCREYNEHLQAVYTLNYAPSFPKTIGHVLAIDAISGEAMYVDVGDATFYL